MAIDYTKRDKTRQERILFSIVDRLIDQINELNDQNCWLSDQPVPLTIPGGRFAVTVSPGGGNFPHEFFSGGGSATLVEESHVVITPIVVNSVDRPRRSWRRVAGSDDADYIELTPNLLSLKRQIIKSLVASDTWEPSYSNRPILRDQIAPVSCTEPSDVSLGETAAIAMQIRFSTVFDWDLS